MLVADCLWLNEQRRTEHSEDSVVSCRTRQLDPIVQDMGLQQLYATIADAPTAASVLHTLCTWKSTTARTMSPAQWLVAKSLSLLAGGSC